MTTYEPIIGMEIHVELKTKSKMFCGCKNDPFNTKVPNSLTCPVCLGLPGALPVPNRNAVEWCMLLGLALNCEIPLESKFDRKHYFYPDLPKGYQISQYDQPLCQHGYVDIQSKVQNLPKSGIHDAVNPETTGNSIGTNPKSQTNINISVNNTKRIRIRRVHMEEDTGKLMHETIDDKKVTLVDFNRSGVPLVEIVTEPDICSGEEARIFLQKLHQIIMYLGISEAEMSQGSMRLEPNISVREIRNPKSEIRNKYKNQKIQLPNYKVEVKNINSFKFVEKAINFEIDRHIILLESGETPVQETRGFVESTSSTVSQRTKEEAHDYRYFPEPDIPPMKWNKDQISNLKSQIPELPDEKANRFIKFYKLNQLQAEMIVDSKEKADYFETAVHDKDVDPVVIAKWIINKKPDIRKVNPDELVKKIKEFQVVDTMSDNDLSLIVREVIHNQKKAVDDYKKGKEQVFGFLFGMVLKKAGKKLDPAIVRGLLSEHLR